MKILLAFFLFLLFCSSIYSQENRDSLRQVITTTENDTVKISSMCILACDMTMFSPDSLDAAIEMTNEAIALARSEKIRIEEMRAYYDRAWMYYVKGELTPSVDDYESAITLAEELNETAAYHNYRDKLATLYFETGRKDEALELKYTSLDYFKANQDSFQVMASLSGFIHGYMINNEFEKARDLLWEQLHYGYETPILIETHGNLGLVHFEMGEFDSAEFYIQQASKMGVDYPSFVMNNELALAKVLHAQGNKTGAIELLLELDSTYSDSDEKYLFEVQMLLAEYYLDQGKTDRSSAYFSKAEIRMADLDLTIQRKRGEIGYQLFEKKRDYQTALDYYKIFHAASDSINQVKRDSAYKVIESQYNIAQKEKEINAEKLKNRNLMFTLLALAALLTIGSLAYYFRNKNQKIKEKFLREKARFQESEIANLKKENLLVSMQSILEGQEEERRRIAQDLHDNIGSMMAAIKMKVLTIQENIEALEKMKISKQLDSMVGQVSDEVRRISHNMTPLAFGLAGLSGAVHDLSEQLDQNGIRVSRDIQHLESIDNKEKAIMIYRIFQEIVQNIIRHSEAEEASLSSQKDSDKLKIEISDNGKGLEREVWDKFSSLGLKSIQSRVSYLGGSIVMDNTEGTKFTILIPLDEP